MAEPPPKEHRLMAGTAHFKITGQPAHLSVKRGEPSWAYFYVFLGFALGIEASVISFIEPLLWYWKLVAFVVTGLLSVRLVLYSSRFQNMLLRWKMSYEDKVR